MLDNISVLEAVELNIDVLPTQLLCVVKEHMRVEFDRDDQYIRGCIARAISEVQNVTDISINPATYKWRRRVSACRAEVPKTPIRRVYYVDTAGARVDVPFELLENRVFISATAETDLFVECGYPDSHSIPASVMNAIFMIAGTLYETRESLQFGSVNEVPDMARRLMSGLWRPSV